MIIRPNTTISGRYTVLEQIGVGGMAVVYKALDQKLNRAVTFKVLKEEFTADAEFIKRFEVEAQAAARLSHSNIVNAYDVGNDGNVYYIVMEYIDGVTLKELINKRAPFDNQEALSVAIQIASALEEAHKNNIVHRDIKPHNILVTKEGVVKVTDFGIARAATSTTVTVESMGSVHYFSPEQARGGFVDAKSDIYSLGIVLFEMVTGRLPFEGDTPVALAMKHLRDPIPDIKTINPNVSQSIEMIILKATQKSSSKRYQRVDDMNRDLKRATNNPTGNFVSFDEEDVSSQTIRVTEKELDEIKIQARQMYDDDFDDDYDDYRTLPKKNNVVKYNDGYNKKKERTVVIAAVVTALVIIAAVTFAGSFFLTSENEVAVPDFVGKTWDEALEIAKENKIYLDKDKVKSEAYSDDIEEGLIMSQNLDEGDMIDEGDTVYVVMSLGSDKVKMPNVTNISFEDATDILSADDVNLKWSEEYEYNDEVEKSFIIRQEPEAGEFVSRENKVVLYVSRGEESSKAVVPYVVGKSESEAVSMLRTEGFEPKVSYTKSEYVDKGKVVSQNVQSGNEMEEGSTIVIYVSEGKEEPETEAKTEPITEVDKKDEPSDNNQNDANDGENGQDADQEQNQPEESQEKIEIIVVDPYIADDVESVEVKIVNASDGTVVYSGTHNKSEFPFSKQVKGSTPTVFQLYIDGKFSGEETKFQ